ncbi:hypothetical protein BU24DRAFT_135661 [Aaosphaeria arxii CBS 175.79]|uniref:Uncharacterized protein n=1 Tax=Aaosphaeria arxii CBS 175.79 TaxID=1450172 RepID=A0A6A5Y3U3_9PLEO|nr:uncharacterized protein BU24DRAFT_135661 [Aaosphaeria arxii CBS 175.79]KAF2020235.1 hypothetical protein BU24DRAFT_135661 [Aaosphaeria arxii CBS 175.79]
MASTSSSIDASTNNTTPSSSANNENTTTTTTSSSSSSSSTPSKPKIAFISGPLDPSESYFQTHYVPLLDAAIASSHHFIIGPVAGVDTLALQHLLSRSVPPSHITIYMAHFEYLTPSWRNSYLSLGVNVRHVEDAIVTEERDEAMTRDSDYDILRYRTEAEAKEVYGVLWRARTSNTEMNERRRRGVVSREYDLGGSVTGRVIGKEEEEEEEGGKGQEDGEGKTGFRERVMRKLK